MQNSFSAMARMAALTTDVNGVPVTVGTNFSEFCTEFCRKSPIGRARCEQCDKMGAVKVMETQTPFSYFCHANLVDFAAPIMLGNRMIKENPDTNHIPICFLTGVSERSKVEEIMALRPRGYLLKPINAETLLATISNLTPT